METNAMREVEAIRRNRLDVYRSRVTPGWAWPSFAVAVFLFVSSYELEPRWVHIVAPTAYAAFCGVWLGIIRVHSGVRPRLRGMPKTLFGEVVRAWVGGALLVGAAAAIGMLVSWVLAGLLAAVATFLGGREYDRRYRRRADALAGDVPMPADSVPTR
jgi:hypothetical protein